IEYSGIDNKCLISNDIAPSLRKKISNKELSFTYKIEKLNDDYTKLIFSIPSTKFVREFYFKGSYLVSSPFYFGRKWLKEESKFFIFHISNPLLFNHYAEEKLDNFVDKICNVLKLSNDRVEKLKDNKIHYYLCSDTGEIKSFTGYEARGLYYLPYDYIISTFNCHYHEILHLLINYKLKTLSLYTLPLLQEGFAVAFGGRGGKEPDVILEMGAFLATSNFLNYNFLLDKQDFNHYDATMTYPLAGLYNKFLIDKLGIDKYINLYKKYSGTETKIEKLKIIPDDLPPAEEWGHYLKNYSDSNSIKTGIPVSKTFKEIGKVKNIFTISENQSYYLFLIKDTLLLSPAETMNNYRSKLFHELLPDKIYNGEEYAVIADSNEISVYNFYSNNLIAKYVRSFTWLNKKVPHINNLYQFLIEKNIFDKPLNEMIFN
ncbi:MAG: hypothetical protein WAM24_06800, partial [Ignavibacteriaceae bacterium]